MFKSLIPGLALALVVVALCVSDVYPESRVPADVSECKSFEGRCGDVDANEVVNISDAVSVIAYVFGSGETPERLWAADVNLSGFVNITDAVYLLGYIFGGGPEPCAIQKTMLAGATSPYLDCLEYEYDGEWLLQLRHRNAAFNCCPQEITVDVYLGGSTILVVGSEDFDSAGPCPCLCLYDLDFAREGILPGVYSISVEETYIFPDDELLKFQVDLSGPCSGSYCVYRDEYPWGSSW